MLHGSMVFLKEDSVGIGIAILLVGGVAFDEPLNMPRLMTSKCAGFL